MSRCAGYGSLTRFVGEHIERFASASSMRPVDRVESEIVSQLRVGARVEKKRKEMRVTEDRREDERRLPAAGAFVDVGSVSQHSLHRTCVAGSYRLR